jgi:chloramphenicol 3-O-phosphotransferase
MDKTITVAGVVAGGIAVTAGGGVTIVAEGWPEAVLVTLVRRLCGAEVDTAEVAVALKALVTAGARPAGRKKGFRGC